MCTLYRIASFAVVAVAVSRPVSRRFRCVDDHQHWHWRITRTGGSLIEIHNVRHGCRADVLLCWHCGLLCSTRNGVDDTQMCLAGGVGGGSRGLSIACVQTTFVRVCVSFVCAYVLDVIRHSGDCTMSPCGLQNGEPTGTLDARLMNDPAISGWHVGRIHTAWAHISRYVGHIG